MSMNNHAIFAAGCFWGVEAYFDRIDGVKSVRSGYGNGETINPSYEDVVYKNTNHAETVEVKYDPKETDLTNILIYYLPSSIDSNASF